jgi:Cyclic-phosphate processing Receiver domain
VKVWLDDLREAPEGWIHVKTPKEAIGLLRSGEVEEISLDHDLGLTTAERERTGYDVLAWLEEGVAMGTWEHRLPKIHVHSANPVGRRRIEQAIRSINRVARPGHR